MITNRFRFEMTRCRARSSRAATPLTRWSSNWTALMMIPLAGTASWARTASAETADNDGERTSVGASSGAADDDDGQVVSNEPGLAATVNLAGFALFGPDVNVAYGSEYTGFARVRPFGLGYLSHSMFTPDDNQDLSLGSLSIGLGGHRYFGQSRFSGAYLGVVAEYLMVEIDEKRALGTLTTSTSFLIPSLEGGYRMALGSLLVGGGLQVGYALALSESCTFSAGTCDVEPRENTIYGQLALDVGVLF